MLDVLGVLRLSSASVATILAQEIASILVNALGVSLKTGEVEKCFFTLVALVVLLAIMNVSNVRVELASSVGFVATMFTFEILDLDVHVLHVESQICLPGRPVSTLFALKVLGVDI